MAKPLDPFIKEILLKHGLKQEALWDCHGTWVMTHKYVELIGAKIGAVLDKPEIMYLNSEKKELAILVVGRAGSQVEWSFGEVSPANNKNAYPWAMAEKRAKDRVILKLAGLAGHVYSEEEADDFKATKPVKAAQQQDNSEEDSDESAYVSWAKDTTKRVNAVTDPDELTALWKANLANYKACSDIDEGLANQVKMLFTKRKAEISQQAAE